MDTMREWVSWHIWLVLAGVWVSLCLLLLLGSIIPQRKALADSYEEWLAKEKKVMEMDNWEVKRKQLETQSLVLEEQLKSLYVTLPENDQMSVILDCLHKSSQGIELSLRQIKTEDLISFDSHEEQPFIIVAQGGFHAMGTFIDRVEHSPFLMKVESMQIRRAGMLEEQLSVEVHLHAIVVTKGFDL